MTGVANVYGQALFDLATEEGLDVEILCELKLLKEAFTHNPDFVRLLASPSLSKEERLGILDESFGGRVHAHVLNFMKILTERGYIRHFADCCEAYREEYNRRHGIMAVRAVTAVPLSPEQADRLTGKLSELTGKTIELINVTDAACIGGMRLDYDGKRVDDTVRNRLDALHDLLKNTIL